MATTPVEPIGAEYQLSSPLGRAIRKIALTGTTKGRVSMVKAMGGQIALSSPMGQFMLRAARNRDNGSFIEKNSRQRLAPVGAEEQLSSPYGQWARRLK